MGFLHIKKTLKPQKAIPKAFNKSASVTRDILQPKGLQKEESKVGKFVSKPKNIKKIGSKTQQVGELITVAGAVSGQPELVGLGAGLTAAGGITEKSGSVAQKVAEKKRERIRRRREEDAPLVTTTDIKDVIEISGNAFGLLSDVGVDTGKVTGVLDQVEQYLTGDGVTETVDPVLSRLFPNQSHSNLADENTFTIAQNVIQDAVKDEEIAQQEVLTEQEQLIQEQEQVKQSQDIIQEQTSIINELGDRLNIAQRSPLIVEDFIRLGDGLTRQEFLDLLSRNSDLFLNLTDEEIRKIMSSVNLVT